MSTKNYWPPPQHILFDGYAMMGASSPLCVVSTPERMALARTSRRCKGHDRGNSQVAQHQSNTYQAQAPV
jgi:hypothetical protein